MKAVKIEDTRKDCIYYAENKLGGTNYIFRANKDGGGYKTYVIMGPVPTFLTCLSTNFQWLDYNLRFPTTEEADWLVECEQAGKFVPKPETQITRVINNYEIY